MFYWRDVALHFATIKQRASQRERESESERMRENDRERERMRERERGNSGGGRRFSMEQESIRDYTPEARIWP